eukprot:m.10963 g.10963  ORF g.10963 m.10963 type:complete len:338 (+) comp22838_c0_seq1:59-1072(+)
MTEPREPSPPSIGKVSHHSIELYWRQEKQPSDLNPTGNSSRLRYIVEEENLTKASRGFDTIYNGFSHSCAREGLEAHSQYRYRLCVCNDHGASQWSQPITISTAKRPFTGEDLHKAVANWDIDAAKKILAAGNVPIDTPDKYGSSALMAVAQKGYRSVAELLLDHGADVNYSSGSGKTSLMIACYHGHLNIVQLLIERGAKYSVKDKGGSSALHWAVDGGQEDMVTYLIRDGVPVDERDGAGWTPLIRNAAVSGHIGIARILLAFDADIDAKDDDGRTALMIASLNGHKDLTALLVHKGADKSIQNKYGANASDFAESFTREGVLEVLRQPDKESKH